ncbi:MAG: S-methyl-5-thioribose-1-phosphate isomerase [Gemmatimonadetes bacterium]|nr:S-methyl-5-thioribose-1-phosphate isomerase [Gemmatimonadota bacterium]
MPPTVAWSDDGRAVRIVDQRRLPAELAFLDLRTVDEVVNAIRTLAVRGAPAIGVAGAMGLAVALREREAGFAAHFEAAATAIARARPTAVNLPWAIARMRAAVASRLGEPASALRLLHDEAERIRAEDEAMCLAIGTHGLALLRDGMTLLTHCNAGALATAGIGTALAPVHLAARRGWRLHVYADETRPLLQGARLTMWELLHAGVQATLITDNMAAATLRDRGIEAVLVGADRICANGDVVNKVGTYGVALAAHAHGVPVYVLAPSSTVDPATARGADVHIEQRDGAEVTMPLGAAAAPAGAQAYNPAFDWTPARLVSAIVTDRGVHRPPYDFSRGVVATSST